MRIEWKSDLHGVACCRAGYKLLGEGEAAGTFEAYVAIFGTLDRPDFFGGSDIIEPGAITGQTVSLAPYRRKRDVVDVTLTGLRCSEP